jgi:glycosyltransferase involved in cell wall biosynthesis
MRVAVEVSHLQSTAAHRGLGRYASAVVGVQSHLDDVTLVPFSLPLHDGRFGELRSVPRRLQRLWSTHADLEHVLSPYLLGRLPFTPWVVSVLDLIPLLVTCHQQTGTKARFVHRWAQGADSLLTLSEYSKSQIVRHLGVAPERIVVAPLPPVLSSACGDAPPDSDAPPRVPYALAVADCTAPDPRKRVEWLEAVSGALDDSGGLLVVVGHGTERRFQGVRGVEAVGPVTDPRLRTLMQRARLFVFPSAYEGQGLPPLEAMSCGTPVVAMNNTSIPEVVGGGGVLVEEETADWANNACRAREQVHAQARFVEACVDLFGDASHRADLGARALRQSQSFDEHRFAVGLRAAYELASGGS